MNAPNAVLCAVCGHTLKKCVTSATRKEPEMANDELYTPRYIFDALGLEFDLDPCSPETGAFVPAKQKYSLPFDGLNAPWFGLVWMNPPFSKPSPWVEKWINHGNGIALLPLSGNAKWWHEIWNSKARMMMLKPNTPFTNSEGHIQKIMYGVSLWAIGETSYQALINSKLGRVR